MLDLHLAAWHWMRDRDLIFEPWDTPMRVLETALRTGEHAPVPYRDNLERNLFGLGFHADLARGSGRRRELAYAGRMLHDLNVERENHHVLWLRYSYPLRRVFLELERRLIDLGAIEPGDIWFFEAPELIAIADRLPTMPEPDLVAGCATGAEDSSTRPVSPTAPQPPPKTKTTTTEPVADRPSCSGALRPERS